MFNLKLCVHQWRRQAWGSAWGTCFPLEFVNARKFVICSVEGYILQQIDIERLVDRLPRTVVGIKVNRII